jgi:ribose transport system permease protein
MNLLRSIRRVPAIVYVILVIVTVGVYVSPHFLTVSNFTKIMLQSAILVLVATGMTLVVMLGETDLSPGAVLSLASMVTALLQEQGVNLLIAAMAGVGVGLLCGTVNALVIVKGRVAPFVATFGMMGMAQGIALGIRDAATISGLNPRFVEIVGGSLGPIPTVVVIAACCFLIFLVWLRYGKLGAYLSAMGTDINDASYAGINVGLYRGLPFVVLGLLAGIAGVVFTARLNCGHPTGGIGYEFEAIAAVVVGGNPLAGGSGSLLSTLLGVVLLSILKNSLTMLGYPIWWQLAISGAVLILALLIPNLVRYRSRRNA